MANLEDRVAALEQALSLLGERLGMEAGLAAGRDRDLSDLAVTVRSHTAMLQAVQERQADHGERFDRIDSDLAIVKTGQLELRAGQQAILALLTSLADEGSASS